MPCRRRSVWRRKRDRSDLFKPSRSRAGPSPRALVTNNTYGRPAMRGTIAWLPGYRLLAVLYERTGSHFLGLVTALTCHKGLEKLAT